jgi:hypothetical protein
MLRKESEESERLDMTIDEAIEFYETSDTEFKQFVGGHCDSVCYLDKVVAISRDTTEAPDLEMISESVFIEWMQAAKEEFACGMHDASWEAVNETRQDYVDC